MGIGVLRLGIAGDDLDLMARLHQTGHQIAADVAGAAYDQNLHTVFS